VSINVKRGIPKMKIKLSLSSRTPPPVRTIKIDGLEWDLDEVYELMSELKHDTNIYMTGDALCQKLLELKVVKDFGSNRLMFSPTLGPNFDDFYNIIKEIYAVHIRTEVNFGLKVELPAERNEN
jgi:hypothetical protein